MNFAEVSCSTLEQEKCFGKHKQIATGLIAKSGTIRDQGNLLDLDSRSGRELSQGHVVRSQDLRPVESAYADRRAVCRRSSRDLESLRLAI